MRPLLLVATTGAACWGGLVSVAVHMYRHTVDSLIDVLAVASAFWWGALVVGVGCYVFALIVTGFAGRTRAGRLAPRPTREADLDTVLRFTGGHR